MLKFNIIFPTFGDASAVPARAEDPSLEGYGMGAEWVLDECLMRKMNGEANLKITKKIALGAIMGLIWIFFLIFANLNK